MNAQGVSLYPRPLLERICRIVIVKPFDGPCVAERILEVEGVEFDTFPIRPSVEWEQHPQAYAELLADAWRDGEGFINLEHDIAPWPGALKGLWECPEPYCFHRYPVWPPKRLGIGVGCTKIGAEVLEAIPNAWQEWHRLAWWDLGDAIVAAIRAAGFPGHEHLPPVGHARRPMGTPPEELP